MSGEVEDTARTVRFSPAEGGPACGRVPIGALTPRSGVREAQHPPPVQKQFPDVFLGGRPCVQLTGGTSSGWFSKDLKFVNPAPVQDDKEKRG